MSTRASSTNGSRLNSRLSQVLWLWWSVSNVVDAGVDDRPAVSRAVYCVGEVDRVLGAVVQLAGDGVVLVVDRRGRDLAVLELLRVPSRRGSRVGTVVLVSARNAKKAAITAATTTTMTTLRRCLGTATPRRPRKDGRTSLADCPAPLSGPAWSSDELRSRRTRRCRAGCGSARRRRGRSRRRTSGGMRKPTYFRSRSTRCRPSFTSSAHTSSDAGPRAARFLRRYASVRPESTMSSTISDVAIGEVEVEVLEDAHDAARARRRAVRRHRHEVELDRQVDRARQVAHEHERALEHADEQRRPAP